MAFLPTHKCVTWSQWIKARKNLVESHGYRYGGNYVLWRIIKCNLFESQWEEISDFNFPAAELHWCFSLSIGSDPWHLWHTVKFSQVTTCFCRIESKILRFLNGGNFRSRDGRHGIRSEWMWHTAGRIKDDPLVGDNCHVITWIRIVGFQFTLHWRLIPRVQMIVRQHWFM